MNSLDYFIGRAVVDEHPSEDGYWAIQLEGGSLIRNGDPSVEIPQGLIGSVLLSAEDDTLRFGFSGPEGTSVLNEITLKDYTLASPESGVEHVDISEDTLPEDPSAERVAEGPTG